MTYASGERPEVGDVVRTNFGTTETVTAITFCNSWSNEIGLRVDGDFTWWLPGRFTLLRRANLNAASEAGKAGG